MAQGKNYRVGLLITGDAKGGVRALKLTSQEVKRLEREQKRASRAQREYAASTKIAATNLRSFVSVAKVAAGIYATLKLAKVADEYRLLESRIKLATEATGDYNRVSRELFQITQQNGTVMRDSVTLFQSLARTAPEVGATTSEVLTLTNSLQQLGVVSGASGEAMSNSMRQFSQAMAGGVVRAEEWNSIVENTPAIAARIAEGLGKSVGQLRLMVVEGKVASKEVFESLLSQTDAIQADFEKMPLTVERSMTMLGNSSQRLLGVLNEAGGATGELAESIRDISRAVDELSESIQNGQFQQEWSLWGETFTEMKRLGGETLDFLADKIENDLGMAWSDILKNMPALLTVTLTEIFGIVDRAIITIAGLWENLPNHWDRIWLNIKTKAREWWAQITHIFSSDEALGQAMAEIQAEHSRLAKAIDDDIASVSRRHQAAIDASREAVAALREEQFERMNQRRSMADVNAALEDLMASNDELFGFQVKAAGSTQDLTIRLHENADSAGTASEAIDETAKVLEKYGLVLADISTDQVILDRALANGVISWDEYADAVLGAGETAKEAMKDAEEAVGDTTDAIFDMDEAMRNVQNNIQSGFSDLFYDLFSRKGVDSFKDFAKRVLDIFKRLIADMAAAWVASKIFNLPVNFGGGGIGGLINGGGIGGSQGQGAGTGIVQSVIQKGVVEGIKNSALGKAVSNSAVGKAVATWWAKNVTGQYFAAGNLGFKGPGVMNYGQAPATTTTSAAPAASSAGGIPAWGGAAVMALVAFGAGLQEKSQMKKIMRAREEMMANFSPADSERIGLDSTFIGSLETGREGVERMYAAVDKKLVVALEEANAITGAIGLRMAMNGEHVHQLTGNVEQVRAALEGAQITGFQFAGSLETAIEKGNGLRVNIEGDAQIIKQALTSAAQQGDLAFRNFAATATGASATLTGDIGKWNKVLQDFVTTAVKAAIAGVDNLASGANNATNAFERLAAAARSVPSVGGSNPFGGRDGVDGSHSGGHPFIPFDGYRAILHRGERVLTAAENRRLMQQPSAAPVDFAPVVAEIRRTNERLARIEAEQARVAESAARANRLEMMQVRR